MVHFVIISWIEPWKSTKLFMSTSFCYLAILILKDKVEGSWFSIFFVKSKKKNDTHLGVVRIGPLLWGLIMHSNKHLVVSKRTKFGGKCNRI